MNKKAGVIMWVILVATIFVLSFWTPRKQNKPEAAKPSPTTQENILPNQKRIEEVIAETKRIATENDAAKKKSTEEKANQEIRLAALQKAIDCTGKEWEIHNCNNLLKRLSAYPDIVASLQELKTKGVKIEVETPQRNHDGGLNVGFPTHFHENNIYISVNNNIVIETGTEIEKIKKFLGLPVEKPVKQKHGSYDFDF